MASFPVPDPVRFLTTAKSVVRLTGLSMEIFLLLPPSKYITASSIALDHASATLNNAIVVYPTGFGLNRFRPLLLLAAPSRKFTLLTSTAQFLGGSSGRYLANSGL